MKPTILALLSSGAILLTGCADTKNPTAASPPAAHAPAARSNHVAPQALVAEGDSLARSFALALARHDVRVQVRNAMRASRVTEHKLVLQEYIASPMGRGLLRAAAEELGITEDALLGRVRRLPPLDFYAPYRQHRKGWRATADVQVSAVLDQRATTTKLYSVDGSVAELRSGDSAPTRPVLFLMPAERKSERIDAQPDGPGDVIQDPNDGEISGSYEWVDGDGKTHSVSLAAMKRRQGTGMVARSSDDAVTTMMLEDGSCDPLTAVTECPDFYLGGGGGGGGGGVTGPSTRVGFTTTATDAFETQVEIELRTGYWQGGQRIAQKTLRFEGVAAHEYYGTPTLYSLFMEGGSSDYIRINVYETDWLDGEDYGTRNFYWDDYGDYRSIIDNGSWVQLQTVTNVKLGGTRL